MIKNTDFEKLIKILNNSNEIINMLSEISKQDFDNNKILVKAVSLNIAKIGEMLYCLSDEFVEQHQNVVDQSTIKIRDDILADSGNLHNEHIYDHSLEKSHHLKNAIAEILTAI